MQKFIDKMHTELAALRDIYASLDELSGAAWAVGNDKLSDTLNGFARDIEKRERAISDALSEEVDDRFREAQVSARATLDAALAGAKLAKEESE